MTMVGGMQGFTMGDANFHRNEPDYKRELAQAKELLANQTAYIKTLQEENLRLNKELNQLIPERCLSFRQQIAEKEALIAEIAKDIAEAIDSYDYGDGKTARRYMRDALEKVGK